MTRLNYLTILFLLAIAALGCKKSFLQVDDPSVILREQYVKDLESLDNYKNGIYVMLTQDFYDGRNQLYPELIADNLKPTASGTTMIQEYKWTQRSDASGTSLYIYKIIKACNFVLEKVDEFRSQNSKKADEIKAQVLTIRALVNFTMVNVYAQSYNFTADASHPGIVLVKSSDPFEHISQRNTVSEVYASVIADLNTSISLYASETISTTLSMNKLAAKALLARVMLFKGDYLAAKNLAREIVTKVPILPAASYPASLFTGNDKEALFQLYPSTPNIMAGAFTTNFAGRYLQGSAAQMQFLATSEIVTLLIQDPQDARKKWVTLAAGNYRVSKYPFNVVPGFTPTTQSYYPSILRTSEMCLTAAEAYAKINMEDSARIYLDYIRQRANPLMPSTTATGTNLLDTIYVERRKELSFEGLRMFDLLRWKKPVTRLDPVMGASATLPYPSNNAIAPIPLREIQVTGLQQNPGY